MRLSPFIALIGALALAGCGDPEPEALNNSANASNAANAVVPPVTTAPANNAVEQAPPSLTFDDEAQMLDDADATGLTTRLRRNGDDTANAAAPR